MLRAILSGANGAMGQVIAGLIAASDDITVIAGVDKFPGAKTNPFPVYQNIFECTLEADVIIDFSWPEALHANLSFAEHKGLPVVIGTTGMNADELAAIKAAARVVPVFKSGNMSLGVNLQLDLIKKAAEFLGQAFDVEILEMHHNKKMDAPSGTAVMLYNAVNEATAGGMDAVYDRHSKRERRKPKEIGIQSLRGGTVVGEHSVYFFGTDETLVVTHRALSKQVFGVGALRAARYIVGKAPGMYDMRDIISAQHAITNVYTDENQAVISLVNMDNRPRLIADLFMAMANRNINIDMISQSVPVGDKLSVSFSLPISQLSQAIETISGFNYKPAVDTGVTKITVEGHGMPYQSGVAGRVFDALSRLNVKIKLITTSETKIAMCVDRSDQEKAVEAMNAMFSPLI